MAVAIPALAGTPTCLGPNSAFTKRTHARTQNTYVLSHQQSIPPFAYYHPSIDSHILYPAATIFDITASSVASEQ